MDASLSHFQSRMTLDDLPEEILERVYKQYFRDVTVCFGDNTDPESLLSVFLSNKRQATHARRAMLKHATVQLGTESDVTYLLKHCPDFKSVRNLELKSERNLELSGAAGLSNCFILMDDFFRAVKRLKSVSVVLTHHRFLKHNRFEELQANPRSVILKGMRESEWWDENTMQGLLTGFFSEDDWEYNWCQLNWLQDIVSATAFSGFKKPPKVHIEVQLKLWTSYTSAKEQWQFEGPVLSFSCERAALEGFIYGEEFVVKQKVTSMTRNRGGRGYLCDSSTIDRSLQCTIDKIIERPLSMNEYCEFIRHETMRNVASGVKNMQEEVYLVLKHVFKFDLETEVCRKLLRFLEASQEPSLKIETLLDAEELVSFIADEELTEFDKILTERAWRARSRLGPFEDVVDLRSFVVQSLAGSNLVHQSNVWMRCYEQLYQIKVESEDG